MSHRYKDKEIDFLKENCKEKTTYEITEIFNKHFDIALTRNQIKNCMTHHHLTSDIDRKLLNQFHPRKYTKEQKKFIEDNIKGKNTNQLTIEFNNYFELNIEANLIRAFIKNNGLKSGLDCQFKTDHIPFNKNLKGTCAAGSEKGWFKKGQDPINHRAVGSERINVDGYIEVKVAEPRKWRSKHILIWEKVNGPIEKGIAIIFGDGNRQNTDINNLISVTRRQLLILNRNKLIQNDANLTRTGVIIADLYQEIGKRKKR